MALCSQMNDNLWTEFIEDVGNEISVADVAALKTITIVSCNLLNGRRRAGVGQLVDVQDLVITLQYQVPNERRADEASATGDKYSHAKPFFFQTTHLPNVQECPF